MNAKTLGDLYDVTTEAELGKLMADGVTRIDLLEEGMHAAGLRAVMVATAKRAAELAANAFLVHEIGTPGEGPFTIGQRHADEAREQISAKILAVFKAGE